MKAEETQRQKAAEPSISLDPFLNSMTASSSKEAVDALDLRIREILQHYVQEELFICTVLRVLELGVLPARIYVTMYRSRKIWKISELAKTLGQARSHVYVALTNLDKAGHVKRVSRTGWVLRDVTSSVTF